MRRMNQIGVKADGKQCPAGSTAWRGLFMLVCIAMALLPWLWPARRHAERFS